MTIELKGKVKPGQADRRYYMIRVQVDGRREVMSSGTRDRTAALLKEQTIVNTLQKHPNIPKADLVALVRGDASARHRAVLKQSNGVTLHEAFARCFADPEVWRGIRARRGYESLCKEIELYFGADRPIQSIKQKECKDFGTKLLDKGLAPSTVNKRLACLSKVFNVMRHAEDGYPNLPVLTMLSDKNPRTYSASLKDEEALFAAVAGLDESRTGPKGGPPRKKDAYKYLRLFKVLVETGMRLGEGLRIRWEDIAVDTADGTWIIKVYRRDEIKNRKAKTIPVTGMAREVLQEMLSLPAREKHKVGPFGDLNKRRAQHIWTAAKVIAKITDKECVIHSLRHTLATRLLKATGNLVLVSTWLGHTTTQTTSDTYAHVESDSLIEGAAALTKLRGTLSDSLQASRDRESAPESALDTSGIVTA
ncbi:tyrosine-type recombinase/integrase [Rhodanobacter sp. A1T4]|uniref:tyrosine-type recombinase/integrase n=1 Tax=Rhodanobacter sp. A1T4 TaxID=2723087 RepID=UPI001613EE0C|nr:tyrosine-type recombinase/integrase [Rhodanobacter sp. A1T4]MBB6246321.1 integrase [Rhodanobacter sp. A1T4]